MKAEITILTKRIDKLETRMNTHESQIEIVAEGVQKLHERIDRFEKKVDSRFDRIEKRLEQTSTKSEVNALAAKIQIVIDTFAL